MGDRSVDLPLVAVQKRELPLGPLRYAFGPRRVDSVYLLPVSETRSDGQIAVQFRGQMYWWGLLSSRRRPVRTPSQVCGPMPASAAPQEAALHKLMREEFPAMAPDSNL